MEWLVENWFWILIGILFIALHLFGHRGHGGRGSSGSNGGHGGCCGGKQKQKPANNDVSEKF